MENELPPLKKQKFTFFGDVGAVQCAYIQFKEPLPDTT